MSKNNSWGRVLRLRHRRPINFLATTRICFQFNVVIVLHAVLEFIYNWYVKIALMLHML